MKILFVCTGNTCRSPMAQYIFEKKARQAGLDIEASSAGICAFTGDEASVNALAVMAERGIDISAHRARRLTSYELDESDLVVCMSESHKAALPDGIKCIVPLGGIPDPYGGDIEAYRICADRLERFIGELIADLQKVHVAEMHEADVQSVAELEKECFSAPWSEKALSDELELDTSHFYVAKSVGGVCGYIGTNIIVDECYITNIAVTAKMRRLGIADRLLSRASINAEMHGCDFISLEVRKSNTPAIKLYEKHGFEICGERKNFYTEPTENAYIMTKFF